MILSSRPPKADECPGAALGPISRQPPQSLRETVFAAFAAFANARGISRRHASGTRGPGPRLLLRSPLVLAWEPQGPGSRLTLYPFRALPRELWWLDPCSLGASLSLRPRCCPRSGLLPVPELRWTPQWLACVSLAEN